MTDSTQKEIQALGLNAPRITPERIEATIFSEHYFTALQGVRMACLDTAGEINDTGRAIMPHYSPLGLLTICVLVLRNGFTVTGESSCASPENFNAEIGRKIARQKAIEKIWPLEGYLLKQSLSGEIPLFGFNLNNHEGQ